MNKLRKLITSTVLIILLTVKIMVPSIALAQEAPTPPTAPEAPVNTATPPTPPTAPSAPTPPTAPTAPEAPVNTAVAPTPPTAPTSPITPTSPSDEQSTQSLVSEPLIEGPGSGNVGDTTINTGNATNTAGINNTGNNNLASGNDCCAGGATVKNTGNGTNSNNNASATTTNNNGTNQGNSATLSNNLNQASITGDNNTSYNVGNSTITTGDANVTGTIVNSVNTNVDGVMVSEFNIADDHTGDIILDFAANCIQGCNGQSIATNTGNGDGSTNNAESNTTNNNTTNQTNDANISNGMTLVADSGNNDASFNTGGDSSITTGDANVSANAVTLANNNFAGDVIYGVVNIFGDLVGDIILTQEMLDSICGGTCTASTGASNTNNGANSTNTANANNTTNNNTFQTNDADISNLLTVDAVTGDNNTSFNTDGNSDITTGDANVDVNVLNIANMNLMGGTYWLVLVNQAGNWLGQIMGGDGSSMAGSPLMEFLVDPITGAITATTDGNGNNSTNTSTANNTTNNTINQTNNANISNNLNLTANTGGNDAQYNTGGNSKITTGDANIVANIVNFVNNNVVGDGKLVVTVINVFGSWLGDFVAPGQTKQAKAPNAPSNESNSNQSSGNNNGGSQGSSSTVASATGTKTVTTSGGNTELTINSKKYAGGTVEGTSTGGTKNEATVAKSVGQDGSAAVADKKITINLAWLLLALPLIGIALLAKKSFVPVQKLALRGIHLFL